jgi:hypothetical protein
LAGVDQLLVMNGGRKQAFGPKDVVLREALKAAPDPTHPSASPPSSSQQSSPQSSPVQATLGFAAQARFGNRGQP